MQTRSGGRSRTAITPRTIAALGRYVLLCLRFPQLRARVFFVGTGAEIRVERHARIRLGRNIRIMRDFTAHFAGQVSIGDGVFFNRGCHVVVHHGLLIGDHCLFGEGVSIHDENHRGGHAGIPVADRGFVTAPIRIGCNVWVGAKATILQGVTIGDNAVVGAHAVVTRDVPANTVAVGIPARVARAIAPVE